MCVAVGRDFAMTEVSTYCSQDHLDLASASYVGIFALPCDKKFLVVVL